MRGYFEMVGIGVSGALWGLGLAHVAGIDRSVDLGFAMAAAGFLGMALFCYALRRRLD